jgi:predicted RNase H-like HicB family nuclease
MQQKNLVIYVQQNASGYVAYCPGIGCKAFGKSEKEAMANLQIEIELFHLKEKERGNSSNT